MGKHYYVRAIVLCVVFVAFLITLAGCNPTRPKNVPQDAILVTGSDEHWWEWCSYDVKDNVDHCTIFNGEGAILWNEIFLPYDGGKAATQAELLIDNEASFKSWQYVCLKNGRILIPQSGFQTQKRYLDWATGKSKTR